MGSEESRKHLLNLSYLELQCLCKRYNLPANRTHAQLASSLSSLLEEPIATPSTPFRIFKESTCKQSKHKRGPYTGRDDDVALVHAKHKKGPQTAVGEACKTGIDTNTSISPVPINYGRSDGHGHSSSEPGNAQHGECQNGVGIADKTTNPEIACKHHGSPANFNGQISTPIVQNCPVIDNGVAAPSGHTKDGTGKGCGPSDGRPVGASRVHYFVSSYEEGLNLVVDLNSSPLDLTKKFKAEVSIPPGPRNFSSLLANLGSKGDHSTVSPSGNIVVDMQSKRAESNALSSNSYLGSDIADKSHLEPYPADTTAVNTVSSASALPDTSVDLSGYYQGAPVVSSSCLTAEVPKNKAFDMMVCGLDKEVLPQESVDVLLRSERIPASLVDASGEQTGNKGMNSPVKTNVSGNIQHDSVADTDNLSAFPLGQVVRSGSIEQSSSETARKQTANVPGGAQLVRNCDSHGVLMGSVGAMAVGDIGMGDRLSVSSLARQTVTKLPDPNAQSEASSADHCIAGNFDLTNPTSSSAASDDAVNPLTSKFATESAQSRCADKNNEYDLEEFEESESNAPPVYCEPPRNILHSLRSASARNTKPTRRSSRLVPK